jgi:hypothetical protein
MGTITRSFANNLTTGGVLKAGAFNDASLNNVTALNAAVATGNMVLLSSQTASASASISFTTGIDSTYKEYQFWFFDIHPSAVTEVDFLFNLSTDGGSNYNVAKTGSAFEAIHFENDASTFLRYGPALAALAQGTGDSLLLGAMMRDSDGSGVGIFQLFNPSSTTYVKHYIANSQYTHESARSYNRYYGGYANTTSAINAIRFQMSTGNIDDGTILMFGIK